MPSPQLHPVPLISSASSPSAQSTLQRWASSARAPYKCKLGTASQHRRKITVNKISVAVETIKNRFPTLPLLCWVLYSWSPSFHIIITF